MGVIIVGSQSNRTKRKRRKLFFEDRSFYGDESLTYPEVDQRTIDGDILKLKKPTKHQSKKINVKSVHQFSSEAIMGKGKRKQPDSATGKTPESKKHKTETLDAAVGHDNNGQFDESSTIIDVVGVSQDNTGHTELSNISGHHEEWHFSSPDISVNENNARSLSCDHDSGHSTEIQSEKKKAFVHRFLSDAISTLGMGEECLNDTSDSENSSNDITEAADLISSHKKKQSTSKRAGIKRTKYSKTKDSKTKDESSISSPLSSGQKWLLKQMSPLQKNLSSANPGRRCLSSVNVQHSSEESLHVLEHIRPSNGITFEKKRKKSKKEKTKDKKESKLKREKKQEKKVKKNEKLQKNPTKQRSKMQPVPEDTTNFEHICASNDLVQNRSVDPKDRHNENRLIESNNQLQRVKKISVAVQLTHDEILHQSPIRDSTVNSENVSNELEISNFRAHETKMTKETETDCEPAQSQTLEQLVERASSSLKNCGSSSSNEYSPDLFEEDTNETKSSERKEKKNQKLESATLASEEPSCSRTISSNQSRKNDNPPREKRQSVKNVAMNQSSELIDPCSPWHRLTQDSNGSFTASSKELSRISEARQPYRTPSKQSKDVSRKQKQEKSERIEKIIPKKGNVKCTRCRLWFKSELSMALHRCIDGKKKRTIEEPHRTKHAIYKCDCGKAYACKSSLAVHINSYHLGLRPFKCDECPMSFSVKQTLTVHKRLHSNTLPFECCICSKLTRTMCNLNRHYSQLHRLTPNYPCPFCPRKNVSFFFERDLKEHISKDHRNSILTTVKSI